MKNLNLAAIVLCMFSLSCKKDNGHKPTKPTETNTKTYAVLFKVPQFDLTTMPLTQAVGSSALKDQIKFLHYYVYRGYNTDDYYGTKSYREIVQSSSDANFGTITDSLPEGHYVISFVGTQSKGHILNEIKTSGGTPSATVEPVFYLDSLKSFNSETFYGKIDTVINSPITKNVAIKRVVSKITVNINDAIPKGAAKIVMTIADFPLGLDIFTGVGDVRGHTENDYYDSAILTFPIADIDKGKTNYTLNAIVLPYLYPQITIECYGTDGKLISKKDLPKNYLNFYTSIGTNTNYIFSGSMFNQPDSFNISIDTQWNAPIHTPFSVNYVKSVKKN